MFYNAIRLNYQFNHQLMKKLVYSCGAILVMAFIYNCADTTINPETTAGPGDRNMFGMYINIRCMR
jgi:hypothetical protein